MESEKIECWREGGLLGPEIRTWEAVSSQRDDSGRRQAWARQTDCHWHRESCQESSTVTYGHSQFIDDGRKSVGVPVLICLLMDASSAKSSDIILEIHPDDRRGPTILYHG